MGIPPAVKPGESGSGGRVARAPGISKLCTECGCQGCGWHASTHKEAHEVESQHGGDAPEGQALQDGAADTGAVAVVLGVAVVEGRGAQCGQQEGQHGCYYRMVLLGKGQSGQRAWPLSLSEVWQGGCGEGESRIGYRACWVGGSSGLQR